MHIDVKHSHVYLNGRAHAHAAREGVRGTYRTPGHEFDAPPGAGIPRKGAGVLVSAM